MPFQVSPGVNVSEIDFSTTTPNVSASVGGLVGEFTQGPANQITKVSTEKELTEIFGKPTDATYKSWFTASNFLAYGNNLSVVRCVGTGGLNATAGVPTVNTPTEATISGVAAAAVVRSGGAALTDGDLGTVGAATTQSLAISGLVADTKASLTLATTNRVITVNLETAAGTAVNASTYTVQSDGITFSTVPSGTTVVVSYAQQAAFTLPREDYNVELATSATAIQVNGNAVDNSAGDQFSVSGTTLTATGASLTAGHTVTVVMGARTKFLLTGQDVGATDSITVDDVTTGFTLTGSSTSKLVTMAAAPASNISIKILNASTTTFAYTGVSVATSTDLTVAAGVTTGEFTAKNAGSWGNDLKVYMIDDATNMATLPSGIKSALSGAPNVATSDGLTTAEAARRTELSIVIVSVNASTGAETVLEAFEYLSKASDGKRADGTNIYWKDWVNEKSDWIWALNQPTVGTNWGTTLYTVVSSVNTATTFTSAGATAIARPFGAGANGATPTAGQVQTSYDHFANDETVDVNLLMTGGWADITSGATVQTHVIGIAESRKDCIALVSPSSDAVLSATPLTSVKTWLGTTMPTYSSYAFADSNLKYQYDKHNDKYRWIPLNGDIAGLMVRTDADRDPWFSPAGLNRGTIKNAVQPAWDQSKADRDEIYPKAINPVVNFPGQGVVLYGDRTFTTKPSAFDRVNVRRLFIVLEKSIASAAKFTLFEFNDDFTRSQFTALVEPFLREVKGRRGIYDFLVVCDETNNTPQVVDSNEFVGDIFIKPARSINFIQLNFVATRTGTNFEEIVGSV